MLSKNSEQRQIIAETPGAFSTSVILSLFFVFNKSLVFLYKIVNPPQSMLHRKNLCRKLVTFICSGHFTKRQGGRQRRGEGRDDLLRFLARKDAPTKSLPLA